MGDSVCRRADFGNGHGKEDGPRRPNPRARLRPASVNLRGMRAVSILGAWASPE
jgi:hypothetical protein